MICLACRHEYPISYHKCPECSEPNLDTKHGQLEDMVRSHAAHQTILDAARLLRLSGHEQAASLLIMNADRIADKGRMTA